MPELNSVITAKYFDELSSKQEVRDLINTSRIQNRPMFIEIVDENNPEDILKSRYILALPTSLTVQIFNGLENFRKFVVDTNLELPYKPEWLENENTTVPLPNTRLKRWIIATNLAKSERDKSILLGLVELQRDIFISRKSYVGRFVDAVKRRLFLP